MSVSAATFPVRESSIPHTQSRIPQTQSFVMPAGFAKNFVARGQGISLRDLDAESISRAKCSVR
jgi:hypothetical protein